MLIEVLATAAAHIAPLALLLGVQLWQERKSRQATRT
jgi:hypothetical protein